MRVRAIVNRAGGTLTGLTEEEERIVEAFRAAGIDADVRLTDSDDIFEALKEAASAPGLDAVVAADRWAREQAAAFCGFPRANSPAILQP